MSYQWLDRPNSFPSLHMMLCKSQSDFDKAMRYLKHPTMPWLPEGSNACTHHLEHTPSGDEIAVVCIDLSSKPKNMDIEVIGLLLHEALHIWQLNKLFINEKEPSREFEAYTAQFIAMQLIKGVYSNERKSKKS